MFNTGDDNDDSLGCDGFVDFGLDFELPMDLDSESVMSTIGDWLFPLDPFAEDLPLNKKEWLLPDMNSARYRPPRLYEFLILLLRKPHYASYASFIDRSKGVFQIHQPEKVAELWQAVKSRQSNQKMTYDKFARAVRWYYKSNIMQKTNTRYTFQFSSRTLKNFRDDDNSNDSAELSP